MNLGGGREKFQSEELGRQICFGVDKQTRFSTCTEKKPLAFDQRAPLAQMGCFILPL